MELLSSAMDYQYTVHLCVRSVVVPGVHVRSLLLLLGALCPSFDDITPPAV